MESLFQELGKTIKVLADYGKVLSSAFLMSFVDCKLRTNLLSFPLIADGAVPAYLVNHITLPTSSSNSQASFIWEVFSIGRGNEITIDCDMEVLHTDECLLGTHNCDKNAACTNTDSAFTCSCNNGYQGEGSA